MNIRIFCFIIFIGTSEHKIENFENNFEFLEDTNIEHENSIYGVKTQIPVLKPVKQQNTSKYRGGGGGGVSGVVVVNIRSHPSS